MRLTVSLYLYLPSEVDMASEAEIESVRHRSATAYRPPPRIGLRPSCGLVGWRPY